MYNLKALKPNLNLEASSDQFLDLVCVQPEVPLAVTLTDTAFVYMWTIIFAFIAMFILVVCSKLGLLLPAMSTEALLLMLVFGAFFGRATAPYPSNILCGEGALLFAWRNESQQLSEPLRWDSVSEAGVVEIDSLDETPLARWGLLPSRSQTKVAGVRNLALRLKFDLQSYPIWIRLLIWRQTGALRAHVKPFEVCDLIGKRMTLDLPLDALTLETDRLRLLSYVKSRLPETIYVDNFSSKEISAEPTYTQLWLDDMQSFRRVKTGALEPNMVLCEGRYTIQGLLTTGGQARVYRATDNRSLTKCSSENPAGSTVILKEFVLPTDAGAEVRNHSFASIRNEANFLSLLQHPNIVKILDNFVEDHRAYLVLEYVEGETLRNLIKRNGPLPEGQVITIATALCHLCAFLHNQNPPIVHRDLAPDNLILTPDNELKLIDFSVAQHFEADRTRTVCGKNNYMAPEQFQGFPCTQSDLYSMGGTLYYLITGSDPVALSCSVVSEAVTMDSLLSKMISKLTQLSLKDRYQSAKQVLADLKQIDS